MNFCKSCVCVIADVFPHHMCVLVFECLDVSSGVREGRRHSLETCGIM